MALLKKLNLKDRSTDTKVEYIADHILWSVIFGSVAYFSFPAVVPLLLYERSVVKVVVSMVLASLIGLGISFSYNRKTSGTVFDIKSIRLLTKVNLYRWNIFSIGVVGKYIFPAMFPIIPEVKSISKFMYGRIYQGMESISGL